MTILNLAAFNLEEQRNLNGKKVGVRTSAYVGNITPEMIQLNQDPMYLSVGDFTEQEIPLDVARRLKINEQKRNTESSLARKQGRVLSQEVREEANR